MTAELFLFHEFYLILKIADHDINGHRGGSCRELLADLQVVLVEEIIEI